MVASPFSLAFLTDRRRIANPELIIEALPAGAAVIYRDYDDPARETIARRFASICKRRSVLFLVAGDLALARSVEASGLHLPSRLLSFFSPQAAEKPAPRNSFPPKIVEKDEETARFVITAACHSAEELAIARKLGADLAFLSPVFATSSHPDAEHIGANRFKALAMTSLVPVLALGGVNGINATLLGGPTVCGFGAIGAFIADDE